MPLELIMNNKTTFRVALFDFCGTCVPFQSADRFIDFSIRSFMDYQKKLDKLKAKESHFFSNKLLVALELLGIPVHKKYIASLIKGMPVDIANEMANNYVNTIIIPSLIPQTVKLIDKLQSDGVHCFFVSAAYGIYLNKVAEHLSFEGIISTELKTKNGVLTGKISRDCSYKRKVSFAKKYLNKRYGKNNYRIVFSIGDSRRDIPIIELADRKVVISTHHNKWIKDGYEEIIYGD